MSPVRTAASPFPRTRSPAPLGTNLAAELVLRSDGEARGGPGRRSARHVAAGEGAPAPPGTAASGEGAADGSGDGPATRSRAPAAPEQLRKNFPSWRLSAIAAAIAIR